MYMSALTPRWGGSYEEMMEFARERNDPSNPRLRLLPGYIALDKADLLLIDKEPRQALTTIQLAFAFGEHWEFLYERAAVKDHLDDLEEAMADLNRALALRPGHPRVLLKRAYIHHRAHRWEVAGRDLLAGIRVTPTSPRARLIFDTIVANLIYEGWVHHKAGRREDALRVYDLAAELAPTNQEIQSRRGLIMIGETASDGDKIAALEDQARSLPDNFHVRENLHYELGRAAQFPRIVEMWTVYLATHSNDAAAYLKRGQAYFHMGRLQDAYADARKSCELGNSEGCMRAKQVEAKLKR
jgi:tetratricopeptide (TPR) repeat protein